LWVPEWDGAVPIPAIAKPKPLWSGKQITSMVIPRGINIYRSLDPLFDDGMMVENGDIIFGIVEKKTVGASQGGLVHVVFREKGPMQLSYSLPASKLSSITGGTIAD
jgi:DNA-directed RNA polymerase II subunit RPB1